jgi:hypothetical protein
VSVDTIARGLAVQAKASVGAAEDAATAAQAAAVAAESTADAVASKLSTALPEGAEAGQTLVASGDPDEPNSWDYPYTRSQAEADRWFFTHG